jgi:SRSO17 transposase
MNRREIERLERELGNYLDSMLAGMGRVERRAAMRGYVTGLLLDGERKSIEPIAGRLVDDVAEIQGMRQRLQQAVTVAEWSDAEIFRRVAIKIDRELPAVEALVIDDTGFPKKGQCSVGVKRQYSGTLGRTDNCQVAVSLHLAGEAGSACIDMRLFLPEDWSADDERRQAAKIPTDVAHQPKWKIAINQVDAALAAGVRRHIVLADAGYGDCTEFRAHHAFG